MVMNLVLKFGCGWMDVWTGGWVPDYNSTGWPPTDISWVELSRVGQLGLGVANVPAGN